MSIHPFLRLSSMLKMLFATFILASVALAQTAPVRIMPLGDSITGSPGCWRALLWDHLQKTGITNIDFVGTQPPQGCSVPYDGDNEGHGGALATAVADQNQLPVWLAATHPDIVVMHFGTNDIWSGRTPAVILTAFSKLVDQMRASNPNMIVLVAQIIPVNPSTCADCAQRTIDFNAAIPAWAAGKSTTDSPIIVVDQWTGFNSATDTVEGVHPNDIGFQKMADKWFPVLSALLLGQQPAPGFSLSTPPPGPSIIAGTSGSNAITVTRTGAFTTPVTLSAAAPAGWTVSFSSNPVILPVVNSFMTIAVPATAAAGTYPIVVTGTSGGLTSTTTVNVNVTVTNFQLFTVFASFGIQSINRGTSVTNTINIVRINAFSGTIALSVSGLPAGVTASITPPSTAGNFAQLILTASPTATVGTAIVTISGSSSPSLPPQTSTINLTVTDPTISTCSNPTLVPLPFTRDGAGDFCFVTAGNIDFVNSFNMQLVEINGVSFTNNWSNRLPPRINGNYFIHYVSNLPFSHFEAIGTSAAANFLLVSPASFSFLPTGNTGSMIAITSNTSWTVSVDQPWLTVSPLSGTNNGTLTISATANTTPTVRTGIITVTGGGITQTIGISQGGSATRVLLLSTSGFSFTPIASTGILNVTSNMNWTVASNQPWLTVAPISGTNNGAITVNATANAGPTSRAGVITVSGEGMTRTVDVTQTTSVITPPLPCSDPLTITLPFVHNGEGSFCWVTSGNISFINSWNMQLLEINGVPFTNRWANSFPPRINGSYYIHYVSNVAFGHFEANGTP